MKRCLALFTLIFCIILPLFSSCGAGSAIMKLDEDDRAAAIFDAVNQVNRASYLLRHETKLSGIIESLEAEVNITYDSYFFDMNTASPTVHFESTAETTAYISSEPYTTTVRIRSGYRDGKMYVQNSPSSSMYSNITAEDYFAYLTKNSANEEKIIAALKSAATQTCQRNGDGSWHAAFTDFPEDALGLLISVYFDPAVYSFKDAAINNLILAIDADKNLELKEMQFTLIFDKNASAVTTVKMLEADKSDLPKINFYKFKEIPDLRLLGELQGKINEKLASDSYALSMNDMVTITRSGSGAGITETDSHISFKKADGGITFDYSYQNAANPDVTSELQYRGGVLYATSGGSETVFDPSMNEYEARSYLLSLIDPGNLAGAPVSSFEIDEKNPNQYTLYIESPAMDKYYHLIGGYPLDAIEASARIVLILKDGEISEYKHYLTISAEYYSYRVRIVQANTRVFE